MKGTPCHIRGAAVWELGFSAQNARILLPSFRAFATCLYQYIKHRACVPPGRFFSDIFIKNTQALFVFENKLQYMPGKL
jgi:hypothetical protein